jgi:hypothetical protein
MVSETCRRLQTAALDDTSLWARVELPVNDFRLQQQDKEGFLCRLLRRGGSGGGGGSGSSSGSGSPVAGLLDAGGFVTPTKPMPPLLPPAAAAAGGAALNHDDAEEEDHDEDEDEDEDSAWHRHHHHHDERYSSPTTTTTTTITATDTPSPSYHCRAPHVRSLSLLGARDVTGGCLLAFSPSLQPRASSASSTSAAAAAAPSSVSGWACSLRELDLSHCPALQLPLLAQALPSLRASLTTLSLRNTNQLLTDAAIAAILSHLACPDSPTGATGLRALHLGTSTRRGARPGAELTDATLYALCTRCPKLETLSLHNQVGVTDAGMVALAAAVGGTLKGLDLGLCSSLSDATVLALAGACICVHLRVCVCERESLCVCVCVYVCVYYCL